MDAELEMRLPVFYSKRRQKMLMLMIIVIVAVAVAVAVARHQGGNEVNDDTREVLVRSF